VWQRAVTLVTLASVLVISVLLLIEADDEAFVVHEAGGWPAPLGVSLMADRLAAMMLVTSAIVLFVVAVYAIGQPGEEQARVAFHPLYLVLAPACPPASSPATCSTCSWRSR
jgi:multicomponent Na+:H+ antiporter subunit D